jgi:peptide/nickel transport system substrate-binding protein
VINSREIGANRIRNLLTLLFDLRTLAQGAPSRRAVLHGGVGAVAAAAAALAVRPARADGTVHAIAMHGEPAWAANFTHPSYANPAAPKGGTLVQGVLGSFDCLNPFIVKGLPAANIRSYLIESLLARL